MPYAVSVTKSGQMTIPKALREKFDIGTKVLVSESAGAITVVRQQTPAEELQAAFTKIDSLLARASAATTATPLTYKNTIAELEQTPEGRAIIEAEYGPGIYQEPSHD